MPVVPMFMPMLGFGIERAGGRFENRQSRPEYGWRGHYQLLTDEEVTFTAAVPTVWLMLLQHLEANDLKLPMLNDVTIGGSAVPRVVRKI